MMIILKMVMKIDTEALCASASNGRQALEMVKKSTQDGRDGFDLILMDCNMPFLDGYEATTRIREYLYTRGIRQPIISAVTGHTEKLYVAKAIDSGMNQVLSKPVNHERLRLLLKKLQIY